MANLRLGSLSVTDEPPGAAARAGAFGSSAGGVGFLGASLEAFLPIGSIVGVICKGPWPTKLAITIQPAPVQIRGARCGNCFRDIVRGAAAGFLATPAQAPHVGALQYGELALRMDKRFRLKWVGTPHTDPSDCCSLLYCSPSCRCGSWAVPSDEVAKKLSAFLL
jgi:hypothetical protein